MLNIAYAVVGAVFMVGMAVFAFLKGGQAERLGAGSYLFAWFATIVMQENNGFTRVVPVGMFLIDLALLFAFASIAWRYRQSWPVWASGLQLLVVMCHVMLLTKQPIMIVSLYTIMNLTGYLIILCLIVGTFFSWQERRMAEMNR
ncbi:hypothetical protein [Brevundimonas sp.]|uniref:hypothetical protein n=1 Tax=Brevundimonas sp. TaxID=1871086 RepID=UPI003D0D1149